MILQFLCNILFWLVRFFIGLLPQFPSFDELNVSLDPLFYVMPTEQKPLSSPHQARQAAIVKPPKERTESS